MSSKPGNYSRNHQPPVSVLITIIIVFSMLLTAEEKPLTADPVMLPDRCTENNNHKHKCTLLLVHECRIHFHEQKPFFRPTSHTLSRTHT